MGDIGKTLIILGAILALAGVLLVVGSKIPWLGHLPGDIYIRQERYSFYFPLTTCLLVSLLVSLVLYFLKR